ncbi:MAG: guanylate kinase [Butyrivibrio sp.]|nr:guanylate kinase [Butyrivibrio sp.]
MGKIYEIMGRSSCGKDTIYKHLLQRENVQLNKVIIYTTRPMREKEEEGVQYFFCDEEKYNQLKDSGKIIEERTYNTVYGPWHYFTVDDGQIDLSKGNYLIIGTIEMFTSIRDYFGEGQVVPLMINADDGTILQRALNRELKRDNPGYDEMCRRYLADKADYSEENLKNAGIDNIFMNEDLEKCLEEIESFIKEKEA